MSTDEERFNQLLAESIRNKVDYETQRRNTAAQEVKTAGDTCARANAEVKRQYEHALSDVEAAYRETYDATNAADLVARRQTDERMRRMNLRNSGAYTVAQSQITQQRQAADHATTRRRQAVVDDLKSELDSVQTQNQDALAQETAAIQERAQADIDAYVADQDAFIEQARAVYGTAKTNDTPEDSTKPSGHSLYAKVIEYLNEGYTTEQAYEMAMGRDYASMSAAQAGKQKRDQVRYISPNESPLYIKGLSQPLSGSDLTKYRVAVNAKILWDNGAFGDTNTDRAPELLSDYLLQEAWRGNLPLIEDVGDVLVTIAGGKEPYELFLDD